MAATRVSITVPDDLAERLEPYRDRMNISKVCTEAIERELSTLADLPVEVQELAEAISRLRMEKAQAERQDYSIGLEWGGEYAKRASYRDLIGYEGFAGGINPIFFQALPEDERDNFLQEQEDHFSEFVSNADKFAQGWLDGLMAVWAVLKTKV